MRRAGILLLLLTAATAYGQGFADSEPVFDVSLLADRTPAVAGEPLRVAAVVRVDPGWHVNTDRPGDEFAFPTEVAWELPDGWDAFTTVFPPGEPLQFGFSDQPLSVWDGEVVVVGTGMVPAGAEGTVRIAVRITAQACNDTQCLPPVTVSDGVELEVAPAGSASTQANAELFAAAAASPASASPPGVTSAVAAEPGSVEARLAAAGLPLQIAIVFLAGLALNLTPCVYPLIPITVGFFAQQAKGRKGGTFGLAVAYVLGMAVTYSVLGVAAALTGRILGAALQSPIVIVGIVFVILALAASMFGLWELRVPSWAMRASGGRSGFVGAAIMGLVVGFVAAPCIGPFVLGLLTYVGQQGSPALGFTLFFSLAVGLGMPYLLLGTFTGTMQKLPASGGWMLGVRKVFGVLLLALAAYFLTPLLSAELAGWLMALLLLGGGLYLLVIDRTGSELPLVDRVMRLVSVGLIVAGVLLLPALESGAAVELDWSRYEESAVAAAMAAEEPVILDFYADWCAPCKELDEKTFADERVAEVLGGYARFKVDLTRDDPATRELAARWTVRGVPTVAVFSGGQESFRITGFEPPERFLERLGTVPR